MKRTAVTVLACVLCAGAGWWAGHAAVDAPTLAPESAGQVVLATVREASVGRALPYGVTVAQKQKPVARNALAGVVVSVNPGRLKTGDTVYEVAGVPVRVLQGDRPFYRAMRQGVTGQDVAQLERGLVALGLLKSADTSFTEATTAAVRGWQKTLGRPQTGTIELGEVVAVPALPASITLGPDLTPGNVLSGGEPSVLAAVGERTFALELSADQAKQVPADAAVDVTFKTHTWRAHIVDTLAADQDGVIRMVLRAPDGSDVCGAQCAELPADATVNLAGKVFVIPQAKGPTVPAAAVRSKADGTTFVVGEAGQQLPVIVKAASGGLVVVSGVDVGQRVRVGRSMAGPDSAPLDPAATSSPAGP